MNNKIYKKLFVGFGFVSIVLILTLFVMSQTYIQNLVYHERLSQMEEVTHQMFHSLEDVIDNHWDEVDVQCNYLAYTSMETTDDLFSYLEKLSELANYKEKQIELVAVDAAGHYYTAHGRMGLLRGITYLESAPERVSYVSNSLTVDDSRMVFLKQLSTPITLQSEAGEITLRYFGIAQCMTQLNDYFRCDAYENNNSVYVLDHDGFKLFNANDAELLKGHNVYTVLSQMSYLHGSSFAAAKERLARTGSCYSNAVLDGTEYYYALKQMENAQWTLAFLVPAEYVAVNTQKLVNLVTLVMVSFAVVFSVTAVFVGWFLLRQKQQQELQAEKEANLRLEQYNTHLTQANDEMRRAQAVAAEALHAAERASQAKTDFLSNMSHDIRTPMNAIVGLTTLMENELDQPEKLAEHLHKLESSGQLLLGIINNILDMSRIESGKPTLSVEPMHLSQQLDQLSTMIRAQASEKAQTFTVSTHLRHENLLADPTRLNQVLMNILSNAVKYTPRGGHIRFEVEELPRNEHYAKYRFVVQDDGIGMSEAYQKTLFDPFTREERSGTNKVQGTGLGMAITKNIVDLMGGSISVESATGKGTRFEVVLEFPIDTEADAVPKAQALPEEPEDVSPLCGMNFLCAEDNAINAEILQLLLESKGAHCKIYPNGQELVDAFARVKPGEYDMILMDVQMPVMDGLEATRRIRSSENPLGRVIPILAMTANAFLEDMQKSKEAGMDEHLSKPVDIDALEQTVKRFRVTPPENK
ncbi:hybrid sensor histidine kinase/response regulator [Faecalibacterium prausnitzii]|uniref:Stage 0 sporulation protein A homolog n=1 Tax=Faecalibacterium prausnitzii TaxID=853 RepID=A0A2A7B9C6_9FIRM|nr:ATP-binding protein [Faecalibacterium prausnitzii]PDX88004.1 hybrid sensor histidine kinase/response regulator [Faecalibacterium prausnitzii]